MSANPAFERLLRRDRAVTVAALALLCALTWAYIAIGAGLGMPAWDMTTLALLPHQAGAHPAGMPMAGMDMAPPEAGWGPAHWALVVGMWWAMMVAMMTPAAAPTILLYARVLRHAAAAGGPLANDIPTARARTGLFAGGYFLAWLGFSVVAATLQQALQQTGAMSATMGSRVGWLSGAVLVAAGLYQLSPWKNACLSRCRAPAGFLARHWRPGATGALRLGLLHGAWCIGCCWMLMALLFVGGVMNLAWIAALTLLVLAEKYLPGGRGLGRAAGVVLVGWGLVVLVVVAAVLLVG